VLDLTLDLCPCVCLYSVCEVCCAIFDPRPVSRCEQCCEALCARCAVLYLTFDLCLGVSSVARPRAVLYLTLDLCLGVSSVVRPRRAIAVRAVGSARVVWRASNSTSPSSAVAGSETRRPTWP
jgi:hypothetical protein